MADNMFIFVDAGVINRGINPYRDFDDYIALAENPDIRFVISNTTEAGIAFDPSCRFEDRPGCQIVLFTTGRGTPFGTFVPTAKISTNSVLAANKPRWIDFNAGSILETEDVSRIDRDFIEFVLGIASGELTNNEKSGYSEIAIFKSGVTL